MRNKYFLLDIVITILITFWLLFAFSPILFNTSSGIFTLITKGLYQKTCHQEIHKLICCSGNCTFLCFRCIGLYSGAWLFMLVNFIYKFPRLKFRIFLLLNIPILVDVARIALFNFPYISIIAIISGVLSGFAIISYIRESIIILINKKKDKIEK